MADLTSGVGELERRLAALRSQADQMEHAVGLHPSSPPSTRAWAAPPSPGSPPTAAGLDPNAPDFLARLAELKAQHARNLRELELQLQRGGGRGFGAHSPRSPRSPAPTPSVRPHSAREQRARPDADEAVQRAAELDELLAAARARRPIDTSRLDAARQRWQQRPRSAPPRRPHPRTTVPQPFAFEQRDAERRRELARATSAQRQRRHSEGAATEHYQPFKAQPVPVSTVEPRYERMVARAEQRREQVAAERRKSLEAGAAPFAFLSRPPVPRRRPPVQTQEDLALQHKFKAKPVPANVSMRVYEQMQHEQALRKERVSRQAQEKLAAAALPPRMERHQQMAKVNKVATAVRCIPGPRSQPRHGARTEQRVGCHGHARTHSPGPRARRCAAGLGGQRSVGAPAGAGTAIEAALHPLARTLAAPLTRPRVLRTVHPRAPPSSATLRRAGRAERLGRRARWARGPF